MSSLSVLLTANQQLTCPNDAGARAQHTKQIWVIESARKGNLSKARQLFASSGVFKDPCAHEEIFVKHSLE